MALNEQKIKDDTDKNHFKSMKFMLSKTFGFK